MAISCGLFPTLHLLIAPTWTFSPWASKTSCSPPQSPLGAPLTPAGWSSQSCHWASSSHSTFSLGGLILGFQLQSQDPKVEMPPGHLSLCGPHPPCQVQSQLPSPSPPLPSAECLTVHPVTQTYTPSPPIPTPVSLVKPDGSTMAISRLYDPLFPGHAFCHTSKSWPPPALPNLPCVLMPPLLCACLGSSSWQSELEGLHLYLPLFSRLLWGQLLESASLGLSFCMSAFFLHLGALGALCCLGYLYLPVLYTRSLISAH